MWLRILFYRLYIYMPFYMLSYLVLRFVLSLLLLFFLLFLLVFIFNLLGPFTNPNSSGPKTQAQEPFCRPNSTWKPTSAGFQAQPKRGPFQRAIWSSTMIAQKATRHGPRSAWPGALAHTQLHGHLSLKFVVPRPCCPRMCRSRSSLHVPVATTHHQRANSGPISRPSSQHHPPTLHGLSYMSRLQFPWTMQPSAFPEIPYALG